MKISPNRVSHLVLVLMLYSPVLAKLKRERFEKVLWLRHLVCSRPVPVLLVFKPDRKITLL